MRKGLELRTDLYSFHPTPARFSAEGLEFSRGLHAVDAGFILLKLLAQLSKLFALGLADLVPVEVLELQRLLLLLAAAALAWCLHSIVIA